jgi:Ca2+-binding EF-hand superfamily protein
MWGKGHGGGMMGREMMERYDADKDGKITQAEIDKNRADWLAEFDADKNGTLSLDEFRNLWQKARNEQMVREFQFFDRDGSGQVTLDEYKGPLADIVKERDRNGDGALSRDDRPQRGERMKGWRHGGKDGEGMHRMGPGMMDGGDEDGDGATPPPPPPAPENP